MNKLKKLLVFTLILGFAYSVNAQLTVTSTMAATATIVAPIAISSTAAMGFGNLSVTGVGTVVMTAADGSFTNGGLAQAIDGAGTPGQVIITGANNENFKFTVTQTTPLTSGTSGVANAEMQMTEFTAKVDSGEEASVGAGVSKLLNGTTSTIKIGAKLTTVATQITGDYAGVISVVFQYE